MRKLIHGAAVAFVLTAPATAQDAPGEVAIAAEPVQALAITPTSPAANPMLTTGTEVPLRLMQHLTTRNRGLRVGERFRLETSEPVMVDGVTVIPIGTPAVGEITEVRNKGMWGRSGRFVARVLYLTVNGRRVRLAGEFDDKGKAGGFGAVAVSAVVFLPAGFFMTGTSAELPSGTEIKAFIDEDVPLAAPAQAPSTTVPVSSTGQLAIAPVSRQPLPASDVQPRKEPGNSRVRCTTCR